MAEERSGHSRKAAADEEKNTWAPSSAGAQTQVGKVPQHFGVVVDEQD